MPSIETQIWEAIARHINTYPFDAPVVFPNENFAKPADGGAYYRVTFIPNLTQRLLINSNGSHRRLSLVQIDVFEPLNEHLSVSREAAGNLAAHFPVDLQLPFGEIEVRVTQAPDVAQGLSDGSHWQTPVIVSFETFA